MKISELPQSTVHHIIVFGEPKSGKSTLAGTLAEAGYNLVWISMDNGHSVLHKLSRAAQERIELVRLPDTKDYPIAIETCLQIMKGGPTRICEQHGKVECATCKKVEGAGWVTVHLNAADSNTIHVFDHISQLATSCMNHINRKMSDEYKPTWEDYRVQGTLMDKFLSNIQQSPAHIVCIAHVCETEMEDGAKKLVPLVGTVPFSRTAGKYFDDMVHVGVSNKTHKVGSATTYSNNIVTGSRSDIKIEDAKGEPSLAVFFGKPKVNQERGQEIAKQILANRATNTISAATESAGTIQQTTDTHIEANGGGVSGLRASEKSGAEAEDGEQSSTTSEAPDMVEKPVAASIGSTNVAGIIPASSGPVTSASELAKARLAALMGKKK